jgi:hypothetical protein
MESRARYQLVRPRRGRLFATVLVAVLAIGATSCTDLTGIGDRDLEVIWPRNGAQLWGEETLRARLRHRDLEEYEIYWYVDNWRERRMWNEWYDRTPHKAYDVDTWYWDWNGRGPYTITFIAEDRNGRRLARREVRVYVD